MLKIVKSSAIKARTQAMNQMKSLIVTAPSGLREELAILDVSRLVALRQIPNRSPDDAQSGGEVLPSSPGQSSWPAHL